MPTTTIPRLTGLAYKQGGSTLGDLTLRRSIYLAATDE
jgi:hypothetical protein